MELEIKRWGNSAALRLSAPLLKQLNAHIGDKLPVEMLSEGMLLKNKKKRYSLEELMAQCDLDAPISDDISDWDAMPFVGEENQ